MKANADEVLNVQRTLRHRLLDDGGVVPWSRARDLAAQLLIRVDDPAACWRFGTNWLQAELGADRITAGPCDMAIPYYSPQFESLHPSKPVPSLAGTRFGTTGKTMSQILRSRNAVVFRDVSVGVERDRLPPRDVGRVALKMGMAMLKADRATGMVCAHWVDSKGKVTDATHDQFAIIVRDVLSPILSAAIDLAGERSPALDVSRVVRAKAAQCHLSELTPAELRLARLAATGMSYKEIARELNRSFSTVDHHLRNIRIKFGVNSTTKLATVLLSEFNRS